MEDNLQFFEHEEFGEVRVVMINGEPWLVGKDVATALGYTNPQKALRDHVPDKYKTVNDSFTVNGTAPILINEAGMYKLVMRSKLESAEKFSDWVCGDVLISIRKTGSYSVNKNTTDPLALERDKLALERDKLAIERERLALEREQFNVENSEETKNFKKAQLFRELASAARNYNLRDSFAEHAAKLIMGKDFPVKKEVFDEDSID